MTEPAVPYAPSIYGSPGSYGGGYHYGCPPEAGGGTSAIAIVSALSPEGGWGTGFGTYGADNFNDVSPWIKNTTINFNEYGPTAAGDLENIGSQGGKFEGPLSNVGLNNAFAQNEAVAAEPCNPMVTAVTGYLSSRIVPLQVQQRAAAVLLVQQQQQYQAALALDSDTKPEKFRIPEIKTALEQRDKAVKAAFADVVAYQSAASAVADTERFAAAGLAPGQGAKEATSTFNVLSAKHLAVIVPEAEKNTQRVVDEHGADSMQAKYATHYLLGLKKDQAAVAHALAQQALDVKPDDEGLKAAASKAAKAAEDAQAAFDKATKALRPALSEEAAEVESEEEINLLPPATDVAE